MQITARAMLYTLANIFQKYVVRVETNLCLKLKPNHILSYSIRVICIATRIEQLNNQINSIQTTIMYFYPESKFQSVLWSFKNSCNWIRAYIIPAIIAI